MSPEHQFKVQQKAKELSEVIGSQHAYVLLFNTDAGLCCISNLNTPEDVFGMIKGANKDVKRQEVKGDN